MTHLHVLQRFLIGWGVILLCVTGCGVPSVDEPTSPREPQQELPAPRPAPVQTENKDLFLRASLAPPVALASYVHPVSFLMEPGVKAAVDATKFPIYAGATPPKLDATFALDGALVATHTTGSKRSLGNKLAAGVVVDAQSTGQAGEAMFRTCEETYLRSDGYVSMTGREDRFTLYVTWQAPDQRCLIYGLFSGQKDGNAWDVDSMVVYSGDCRNIQSTWERSKQRWTASTDVQCRSGRGYRSPTPRQAGCPSVGGWEPFFPGMPNDPSSPRGPSGSPTPTSPCASAGKCTPDDNPGNHGAPPTPPHSGSDPGAGDPPSPPSGGGGNPPPSDPSSGGPTSP